MGRQSKLWVLSHGCAPQQLLGRPCSDHWGWDGAEAQCQQQHKQCCIQTGRRTSRMGTTGMEMQQNEQSPPPHCQVQTLIAWMEEQKSDNVMQ